MTARSLADILKASRLYELRNGIRDTLEQQLPDIEIAVHPGKIDIADIVDGDSFNAPSVHVAIAEVRKPTHRVSGLREDHVKVAAYIVVEDTPIDGKLVTRDELGLAIGNALGDIAADPELSRWGLNDLSPPENVEFRPLLTAKVFNKGTAYYVVTFVQQLTASGKPFWATDVMPPPMLPPGFLPPEDLS